MTREKEIEARKLEISEEVKKSDNLEEVEKLNKELDALNEELKQLAEHKENESVAKQLEAKNVTVINKEEKKMNEEVKYTVKSAEYRTAWAKAMMGLPLDEIDKRAIGDAVGTTATLKVDASMVFKYLRVTVKGDNNSTATATTTTAVSEDTAANVTLKDDYGLQNDGTGAIGDALSVSYGSGLGTPKVVTWYFNERVVQANTSEGGNLTDALKYAAAETTKNGAGKYYVVITNAEGTQFTSNVIELTDKAKSLNRYKEIVEVTGGRLVPEWLDGNLENFKGTVKNLPTREMIDVPVDEMLIVELYSK